MKLLKDKVVIVTGSGRGIGQSIAKRLGKEGCHVMLVSRNKNELEKTAREMIKEGARAEYSVTDIRKIDEVEDMVEKTIKVFKKCDILVNNAGVGIFKPVYELSHEEWHKVIDTNLTGTFYVTRAVLPFMRKEKSGYIINISSLAGQNPFAGAAAYCASKFGLNGFTECLMQDVRYDNIKVSYICPGSVNTDFVRGSKEIKSWKIDPDEIGQICVDLIKMSPVSLASKIEVRPAKPPKKN